MNKLKQHIQERFEIYKKDNFIEIREEDEAQLEAWQSISLNTTLDILIEWHKGEMKTNKHKYCDNSNNTTDATKCCLYAEVFDQAHLQAIDYLEQAKI